MTVRRRSIVQRNMKDVRAELQEETLLHFSREVQLETAAAAEGNEETEEPSRPRCRLELKWFKPEKMFPLKR